VKDRIETHKRVGRDDALVMCATISRLKNFWLIALEDFGITKSPN